jgi:hypothetical protein
MRICGKYLAAPEVCFLQDLEHHSRVLIAFPVDAIFQSSGISYYKTKVYYAETTRQTSKGVVGRSGLAGLAKLHGFTDVNVS